MKHYVIVFNVPVIPVFVQEYMSFPRIFWLDQPLDKIKNSQFQRISKGQRPVADPAGHGRLGDFLIMYICARSFCANPTQPNPEKLKINPSRHRNLQC